MGHFQNEKDSRPQIKGEVLMTNNIYDNTIKIQNVKIVMYIQTEEQKTPNPLLLPHVLENLSFILEPVLKYITQWRKIKCNFQ